QVACDETCGWPIPARPARGTVGVSRAGMPRAYPSRPPMNGSQLSGCSMYGAVANSTVPKTATMQTRRPSAARRRKIVQPRNAGTLVALAMLDIADDVEVISPGVVVPRPPVDHIGAGVVAPELVVPRTAEQDVASRTTFEVVVSGSADHDVVPAHAEELVGAAKAADDVAAHRAEHDVCPRSPGHRARVLRRAGAARTDQARAHGCGECGDPLHAVPTSRTSPMSSRRLAHSPARSSSTALAPRAAAVRHG